MAKENWVKYVMQQKEKFECVLNVDNDKIFKLSQIFLYLFLNDSLFPRLPEYNQFHIHDSVDFCAPVKLTKFGDFATGTDNVPNA